MEVAMAAHLPLLLLAVLALQDGADPAPAPATEPVTATKGTGRFVPKDQRAPVAYETTNGLILFKASVAGREVWANLDTGATRTLIDIELARAAGLGLAPAKETINTPHGQVAMQRLTDEVSILVPGQIETRHPGLAAVDMTEASKIFGRKIELVIGQDFLKPLAILIDPSRKSFQFAPSGAFRPPPGAIEVSLLAEQPPRIEVTVGEEKTIVTIDTGSMGNLALTSEAWKRIVPKNAATGTSISTGAEGQSHASPSVVLPEIRIGSLTLHDVLVRESPKSSGEAGLLGMGILGKFRLVLDIKQGKLWLGAAPPAAAGS
jgi:predicted aspartyl protease